MPTRKNTNAAAERLRKVSDSDRAVHQEHIPPSSITPTKRMRSSSITAITAGVRRRKRDIVRDMFRKFRDVSSWSGQFKVALFLVLAFTLWLAFFSTQPTPPTPTTKQTNLTTKSSTTTKAPTADAATKGSTASAQKPVSENIEPLIVRANAIQTFAHDPHAFTQGLLINDGTLWESTGLYGQSQVRKLDLASGQVLESFSIPNQDFGEGLTLFDGKLYQITWREKRGYVYHASNFTQGPIQTFAYNMEGWGLTHNDTHLMLSDGSSTIYTLDPVTLQVVGRLKVRWFRRGRWEDVRMLNELEWINGVIYANIWMTDFIVLIDPATGIVRKVIDAASLHPNPQNREMTLNGIAWDAAQQKLYITGKLWPKMFMIDFVRLD